MKHSQLVCVCVCTYVQYMVVVHCKMAVYRSSLTFLSATFICDLSSSKNTFTSTISTWPGPVKSMQMVYMYTYMQITARANSRNDGNTQAFLLKQSIDKHKFSSNQNTVN